MPIQNFSQEEDVLNIASKLHLYYVQLHSTENPLIIHTPATTEVFQAAHRLSQQNLRLLTETAQKDIALLLAIESAEKKKSEYRVWSARENQKTRSVLEDVQRKQTTNEELYKGKSIEASRLFKQLHASFSKIITEKREELENYRSEIKEKQRQQVKISSSIKVIQKSIEEDREKLNSSSEGESISKQNLNSLAEIRNKRNELSEKIRVNTEVLLELKKSEVKEDIALSERLESEILACKKQLESYEEHAAVQVISDRIKEQLLALDRLEDENKALLKAINENEAKSKAIQVWEKITIPLLGKETGPENYGLFIKQIQGFVTDANQKACSDDTKAFAKKLQGFFKQLKAFRSVLSDKQAYSNISNTNTEIISKGHKDLETVRIKTLENKDSYEKKSNLLDDTLRDRELILNGLVPNNNSFKENIEKFKTALNGLIALKEKKKTTSKVKMRIGAIEHVCFEYIRCYAENEFSAAEKAYKIGWSTKEEYYVRVEKARQKLVSKLQKVVNPKADENKILRSNPLAFSRLSRLNQLLLMTGFILSCGIGYGIYCLYRPCLKKLNKAKKIADKSVKEIRLNSAAGG